jgi:hypothetical protein
MNELIQRLTQRAGLNEGQAQNAAQTVIEFLKQRLPSSIAGQLDSVLGGSGGSEGSAIGDIGKQAAGMFGRKE